MHIQIFCCTFAAFYVHMVKLSIITINYNNVEGLRRTLASVAAQTYRNIEHIIIDGGSTDGSVDVIKDYVSANSLNVNSLNVNSLNVNSLNVNSLNVNSLNVNSLNVIWLSEPDKGIYNAMDKGLEIALGRRIVDSFNRSELVEDKNKGIEIALGRRVVNKNHTSNITHNTSQESLCDYVQILNSGDILAAPDVTERMMNALYTVHRTPYTENRPAIFYGNMLKKDYATGKIIGKSREVEYSLRQYYSSTMNHDCCYIRRDIYEKYGLYDENLKIVSDWKWFLQAIGLGNVKPIYVDIDVTIFDASGISETNLVLRNQERRQVLEELLPPAILTDYDKYAFPTSQIDRLKKYHLWGLVYFMERVLFKLNKWGVLR